MKNKQLSVREKGNYLDDVKKTQELCQLLMETPHYGKLGRDGVFAVVETAKSLGIDALQALGGGLYYVKGKVEMSSRMMGALIRKHKHSITKDPKSDETVCILHGKRGDTGDEWTESFSITEAKRAGLYKNTWLIYPKDMLYARALSRLARQLFPDVIGNCYVEGEIASADLKEEPKKITDQPIEIQEVKDDDLMTNAQREHLERNMQKCDDALERLERAKKALGIKDLEELKRVQFPKFYEEFKKEVVR